MLGRWRRRAEAALVTRPRGPTRKGDGGKHANVIVLLVSSISLQAGWFVLQKKRTGRPKCSLRAVQSRALVVFLAGHQTRANQVCASSKISQKVPRSLRSEMSGSLSLMSLPARGYSLLCAQHASLTSEVNPTSHITIADYLPLDRVEEQRKKAHELRQLRRNLSQP
jgi:hypothetical protein